MPVVVIVGGVDATTIERAAVVKPPSESDTRTVNE
jgi:hypothetical protein